MAKKLPPRNIKKALDKKSRLSRFSVWVDSDMRTCIAVDQDGLHIPLSTDGFKVVSMGRTTFHATFKPVKDYPVEKAARLFVGQASLVGATQEALELLSQIVTVPAELLKRAKERQGARIENLTKARAARGK